MWGTKLFFRFYNKTFALQLHHRYRFRCINDPGTIKEVVTIYFNCFFKILSI
jgi:hypothetical protein